MFILARLIIKGFKILIAIVVVCIFLLRGCNTRTRYDFLHDFSMVESVQIVDVGDYNKEEKTYEINIIEEIDEDIEFIEGLKKVKCTNWSPLFPVAIDYMPFNGNAVMIQISYYNGDWEGIAMFEQVQYQCEENSGYRTIRKDFDEKQFLNLIETYTPDTVKMFEKRK